MYLRQDRAERVGERVFGRARVEILEERPAFDVLDGRFRFETTQRCERFDLKERPGGEDFDVAAVVRVGRALLERKTLDENGRAALERRPALLIHQADLLLLVVGGVRAYSYEAL